MATALTKRALRRVAPSESGFARAKKLADLAVRTQVDPGGNPTVEGYEAAMNYIQPFLNADTDSALDAQNLLASYNNNILKLTDRRRDQNDTLSAFKMQEEDAYFSSFDGDVGSFRDPSALVDTTSEALDNLMLGVINAIDQKEMMNEPTTELYGYLKDLKGRADSMRGLRNKLALGELGEGQSLDGYGYYVDTDPLDGSIRGAALLPVGLAPSGVADGFRRLEATTQVGSALLPVYAPAQRNADGEWVAKVADASWSASGDGVLTASNAESSKGLFEPGAFDIRNPASFPTQKSGLQKGTFGIGLVGRDEEGNPVEGVFYRGNDNKLYSVDQDTYEKFNTDPVLGPKLNSGYLPRFSPTEMAEMSKQATPISQDRIASESRYTSMKTEADLASAEATRQEEQGFFGKLKEGAKEAIDRGRAAVEERKPTTSFFENRVNEPTKPEQPKIGASTPDIVEQGKSFFRKGVDFVKNATKLPE
jgi:hypothetical protein